jgi:hypothetical protein
MASAKFHEYWEGYDTIALTSQMVHADWGKNPNAVAFANLAFKVYYDARRNIKTSKHQGKMLKALHDAATEGSGPGNWNDLKEVFDMLGRPGADRNQWRDGSTDEYRHAATTMPVNQTIWKKCTLQAPSASVKFLQKMDANMHKLGAIVVQQDEQVKLVVKGAKDPARNWKLIGKALGVVKTGADNATSFLWLAPDKVQLRVGRVNVIGGTFLGTVDKIYNAANDIGKYTKQGYSTLDATQLSALKTALSFLPILGGFYAGAIDLIPGLGLWFKGKVQQRIREIDSIPGLWQSSPRP